MVNTEMENCVKYYEESIANLKHLLNHTEGPMKVIVHSKLNEELSILEEFCHLFQCARQQELDDDFDIGLFNESSSDDSDDELEENI